MEINRLNVQSIYWQVIINPKAYSGRGLKCWRRIAPILTAHKVEFQENTPDSLAGLMQTIKRLCEAGSRHFIFLGGDGTANMIVNSLYASGVDTHEVFIVPIPVGTGNDWIHTHNYPSDYREIVRCFLKGGFSPHDAGIVESCRDGRVVARRYFINIAGFGFDAAVIHRMKNGRKTMITSATYIWNLFKTLFVYKTGNIRICSAEARMDEPVLSIAVGICKYNGNGMMQAPAADPFDGLFDVVVIRKVSLWKIITNVSKLFSGTHIRLKEATVFRSQRIEIEANPYTLGEVEGEMLAAGNYAISMAERRINVLMVNE
jgi:YegS/Rv2252/BmrU family lipid kinase